MSRSSSGMSLSSTASFRLEVGQRTQHPADGVAQLAIGIDVGLQDFRADALVLGIVDRRHPQAQDVGAILLDDVLRNGVLPSDLDILRPCSSMVKPWVSTAS
jgi:hypothetical protein